MFSDENCYNTCLFGYQNVGKRVQWKSVVLENLNFVKIQTCRLKNHLLLDHVRS